MAVHILHQPLSAETLASRLTALLPPPTAVVAMGSPDRGDDAAGLRIADRLSDWPDGLVFNVETAPESFLMPISKCGARSCLLVDALDAGAEPGDIVTLEPADLEHTDFTTHGLSPKAFLQALAELSGMHLTVLGVQPGHLRQGSELSPQVEQSVECVAEALAALWERNQAGEADERCVH
jgi:hydrogenase 3 maturation protease